MTRFQRKSRYSKGAKRRSSLQIRRRHHMHSFRQRKLAELKQALHNRLSVVKITWQLHYLTIYYLTGKPVVIYGNLSDAKKILGSRLFYFVSPHIIVNLYYFYCLKPGSEVPTLLFEDKMEQVLDESYANKTKTLITYLQSNQFIIDVRALLK